jgi:hypothetical protein
MKKFKFLGLTLCLTLVISLFQAPSVSALNESEITYFGNVSDYKDLIDTVFHDGLQIINRQSQKFGVRYGFADMEGKIVVPLIYDEVQDFVDGLAMVSNLGLYGFINTSGNEVVPCIYNAIQDGKFENGLVCVIRNKKKGYINKTGNEVIPCIFDYVSEISDGLIFAAKDHKLGLYDITGKIIVPLTYDFPSDFYRTRFNFYFKEGLAPVQKDGKWGYIDKTGKVVIPFIYDDAGDFSEGMAAVGKRTPWDYNLWGFIDITGKEVIPCEYVTWNHFKNGLAAVGKTRRSKGMIDKTGKVVVQDYYRSIDNKSDGYIHVQKSGKYGIIDNTGKEIIPCIYDSIGEFVGNLAYAVKDGHMGIIDRSGNQILPFIYDNSSITYMKLSPFNDGDTGSNADLSRGAIFIQKDGKSGFINNKGEQITSHIYDSIKPSDKFELNTFIDGVCLVRKNNGYGYIDLSGKEIVPCLDGVSVSTFSNGFAYIGYASENNNNVWIVDKKGRTIVPTSANIKFGQRFPFIINNDKIGYANDIPFDLEVTATKTSSAIYVDGKNIRTDAYTIYGNNYFKLSDIAMMLNGSEKQFDIWNDEYGQIMMVSNTPYEPTGGELIEGNIKETNAITSYHVIYFNGEQVNLSNYIIGENHYFKLRDVLQLMNVNIRYDNVTEDITIDTSKNYTD